MKELPILFAGPMVRAILAGTKTQTRRVIKPQPPAWCVYAGISEMTPPRQWEFRGPVDNQSAAKFIPCPYLPASETTLWVRETFMRLDNGTCLYRATDSERAEAFRMYPNAKWSPSIHMPRWASRITLQIKMVRAQLLQDICEEDALAEGCESTAVVTNDGGDYRGLYAVDRFTNLWVSINGIGSWDANPWVWVLNFRHIAIDTAATKD